MNVVIKYNKARIEIESHFKGLPHAHTTLIKSLINSADPITGIVHGISYRELSMLLTIDKAPGRTDAGTPKKETIRSYLRSIEKQCPEDFIVISKGQKLQFQFPKLPEIFAKYFSDIEQYIALEGQQSTSNIVEEYEQNDELGAQENTHEYTDLYTEEYTLDVAVKKLLLNKNNKQETNKQTVASNFSGHKKPISATFTPAQQTVAAALAQGFKKAADPNEIKKFIQHNLEQQTRWEDYDAVFLSWLKNDFYRNSNKQEPKNTANTPKWSNGHVSPPNKQTNFDKHMDSVKQANANAIHPTKSLFPAARVISQDDPALNPRAHRLGLDTNERAIRAVVHQ